MAGKVWCMAAKGQVQWEHYKRTQVQPITSMCPPNQGIQRMLQRQRGLLVVKKEKEDQVSRCESYIDGMETKLQVCQQRRHELGEEMDHDAEENEYEDRDSAQVERLLTEMVQHGLLCIVFCKTRKWCEHVLAQDGSLAPPPPLNLGTWRVSYGRL